jgi:DNA-directed RNA polymerase subunit RPC12/RpoP
MADETVTMEWFYTTPCGACGKDIKVGRDVSNGKTRYSKPADLKCPSCGHQETYKPTAIDNKRVAP